MELVQHSTVGQLGKAERSIVVELAGGSIVGELVVGSIGSIEVEALVLGTAVRSTGCGLVLGRGGRRYHRWGSWGTCWGQHLLGI